MISVIVPVYNGEKYLDTCMESLLSQVYTDYEVILIDDGSTDGSARKCDEWGSRDSRVRVIHQENKGLAQTRNVGIQTASGDYIAWVDSDDYVRDTFLSQMLNTLLQNDADMVLCSFQSDVDGEIRFDGKDKICKAEYTPDEFMERVYTIGLFSVVWNKLAKRAVYKDVLFPRGRLFEDSSVMRKVAENCKKIVVIEEPLYYYRRHGESITMKRRDSEEAYRYITQFVQWLQDDIQVYRRTGHKKLEAFASKHLCDAIINWFMKLDYSGKREIRRIYRENVGCVLHSPYITFKAKVKYGVSLIHIPFYVFVKNRILGSK